MVGGVVYVRGPVSTYPKDIKCLELEQEDIDFLNSGMDEFLGRYGMTKDAAVRIATLFLIALLSIIYVMGRGSGTSVTDAPVAGDSITGTTAAPGQEEGGMPAEIPEFGNE